MCIRDSCWSCTENHKGAGLPRGFLTSGPAFEDENLPAEATALLPSGDGTRGLLDSLTRQPELANDHGIGLFMCDPFVNQEQVIRLLERIDLRWVANLPSLAQHDDAMRRQLRDVGFSVEAELEKLASHRSAGFKTLAVISSVRHVEYLARYPADCALIVQTLSLIHI